MPISGELKNLPVILFPDGESLVAPTSYELAKKAGITTKAQKPFYDVVIVGSGPSGLANGVYAASEGLRTIVIERSSRGRQLYFSVTMRRV